MDASHQTEIELFDNQEIYELNTFSYMDDLLAIGAEFVGTFIFLYMAFATAQASLYFSQGNIDAQVILTISTGFGLAILIGIVLVIKISGAHLNPAVSIALMTSGHISVLKCLFYIVAQLIASLIAAGIVALNSPGELLVYNAVKQDVGYGSALLNEIILTFVLMSVIYTTNINTKSDEGFGPLFIGFAIFVIHLSGIAISSTSVNPARTFGPAVISGYYKYHWIFWVGPIAGSLIASLCFSAYKVKTKMK